MRTLLAVMVAGLSGALLASQAAALCYYKGVDNARTTLAQEFADSRWVVHARVLSAQDGTVERGKPDEGTGWTVYRLVILYIFKGVPLRHVKFFTERDSGGFYMDRGSIPDVGGEYLLFLNPIARAGEYSRTASGAFFVNYSCGQSQIWSSVNAHSRHALMRLSGP